MKNITTFAISAIALSNTALADVKASARAGVHSEYIYRGADRGNETGMADFGLDFTGSCNCGMDWYAGAWFANTFSSIATNEFDLFAGVTKDFGFGSVDLGYISYSYNDSNTTTDNEVYLGASTGYEGLELGLTTSFGLGGRARNTTWIEGTIGFSQEIFDNTIGIELASGYQAGSNSDIGGLAYGSITASSDLAIADDITLSPYLSYIQTAEEYRTNRRGALGNGLDGFVVGTTLSFSF